MKKSNKPGITNCKALGSLIFGSCASALFLLQIIIEYYALTEPSFLVPTYLSWALGFTALIIGIISKKSKGNKTLSTIGIVLGVLPIAVSFIFVLYAATVMIPDLLF